LFGGQAGLQFGGDQRGQVGLQRFRVVQIGHRGDQQ
jgi:hypothetical protein